MFFESRIGLLFAVILALGCHVGAADETREPPLKYRLDVDGKSYAIADGESLKITDTLTNPTIQVLVEPYREFTSGGLSLLYPRSFTFEADLEEAGYKNWTMSGNDFKIMYFLLSENLTAEEYADSMIQHFGKSNCKRSSGTLDLLGEKRACTRLEVTLAGHKMTMDILRLPSGTQTKLLVLQDSPDESGQASIEAREGLVLLQKSLAIK